jgi:mono/diheme cytochrome c family protein
MSFSTRCSHKQQIEEIEMVTHRIFSLLALAVGLVVSCAAPLAPTTAPTQSAPQVASPTQAATQTIAPPQATSQTAIPTKAPVQTAAPTQTAAQTALPTKAAAQPTGTAKLNMDEIFPPGAGREAVLDNCTTCHTIVPLVILQYSQGQWDASARNHRDRVPRMSDADFKAAYSYLAKNFNPDRPVPQLPKELLDTWTDY